MSGLLGGGQLAINGVVETIEDIKVFGRSEGAHIDRRFRGVYLSWVGTGGFRRGIFTARGGSSDGDRTSIYGTLASPWIFAQQRNREP